ncbi:2-oxo acid dehydrogenase subunit E2 [Buchnera aphidicola]|uniref:2-oxo acid dehydrogenase subunit E2 n=1 Tax=Buchnera aphidicola TaxID=9 RepID=UPI003BEF29D0
MDIDINIPDIGLDEVEITEILVQIGDKVEIEQGIITVEGDKSSIEIPSSVCGIVKNIYIKIGDKVQTNSTIMTLKKDDFLLKKPDTNISEKKNKDFSKDYYSKEKYNQNTDLVHATPIIRRLARKLNIELSNIIPTGRKNRILKKDIELYIKNNVKSVEKNIFKEHKEDFSKNIDQLSIDNIVLSQNQISIGYNLHQNWVNIPHVTHFDEVNITTLEKFRQKYNREKQDEKNNITILIFIIKVLAHALEKFPIFNSSLSLDKKKIILNKNINIGIAVDVENDLVVPVLKDINHKNIIQISSELALILQKARQKKLEKSDITHGSMTISNLGGIGGTYFSPIINAPEVAILGVSKSVIKPVWNNKEFIPSMLLPLSLSYDHRVINGAQAARFLLHINKVLSDIHFLFM